MVGGSERLLCVRAELVDAWGPARRPGVKLRVTGGLNWNLGPWKAGWSARYFDSYLVTNPTSASFSTLSVGQGNDGRIDSQIYYDAFVAWDADDSAPRLLARTGIQLGIKNLFNTEPPFDISNTSVLALYSPLGDARLRMYSISLKHAF